MTKQDYVFFIDADNLIYNKDSKYVYLRQFGKQSHMLMIYYRPVELYTTLNSISIFLALQILMMYDKTLVAPLLKSPVYVTNKG